MRNRGFCSIILSVNTPFSDIETALQALAQGECVIVVDDPDRENEGDLIFAAEKATPAKISFVLQHTSGVLCVAMTGERLDELHLPPMVSPNTESQRAAFTISVDAYEGTTSGISATDRAITVRALASPSSRASDFRRPGHVFPLRAVADGVLARPGHTEAAVDLLQLAALEPVGVLCEIVRPDYAMAKLPELISLGERYHIPLITIADLIAYREKFSEQHCAERGC